MQDRLRDVLGQDVHAEHGAVPVVLLEVLGAMPYAAARSSRQLESQIREPCSTASG